MKKLLLTLLASLLVSGFALASGQSESKSKTTVTDYEFWTSGTSYDTLYQQLVQEFEKDNPTIHIELSFVGMQIAEKLKPMFVSGQAPDILTDNSTDVTLYATQGVVIPIDQYLSGKDYAGSGTWKDTFINGALSTATYNNQYYIVPMSLDTTGWFYNKTLWDKMGWTVPNTWNDFIALLDKMSASGIAPIAVSNKIDYYSWLWYDLAIRMAGPDKYLKALSGKASWNDPDFIKAADLNKQLVDRYEKGWTGMPRPTENALLAQGKAGVIFDGDWIPSEMQSIVPSDWKWGMFAFPPIPGQKSGVVAELKTNGWAVSKDSKHPDAAIQWLKFMTSASVQKRFVSDLYLSPTTEGIAFPGVLDSTPKILAGAQTVVPFYAYSEEPSYRDYVNAVVAPAITQFDFGQISSSQAFVEALDQATKSYGK